MSYRPRYRPCHDCKTEILSCSPRQVRCSACKFWFRVEVKGPDECWLFKKGTTPKGYGAVDHEGRMMLAHEVAWSTIFGRSQFQVLHVCNVKPCCNFSHLYDGTALNNVEDMIRAGTYRPFGNQVTS